MRISARNVIAGTVTEVKPGPVNAQVRVDVGGGTQLTAMITSDSVRELGIAEGKAVHVAIKASDVMLGVD